MRQTKIFAVLVVGILLSTLAFPAVRAERASEEPRHTLLKACAGATGNTSYFPLNHNLEKFPLAKGRHEGHLVLVPCLEGAYYYPRLTHIWGGTLEFPMTLTVDDDK